ncbi:hypothetical protein [Caproiciproducens sp. CPB-2]|jgi:hypothetical protein|uniref:hypothetical protein n=1 Tax=unclassified Caproiciproducens TaxID=2643836 RepID=UPI0023DC4C49|nr:hypothetical protein [Caproiciproducens sp. CPB-2]MDF1494366.1 hypothetical protein [Caproiciproducens sp. CPB-2]
MDYNEWGAEYLNEAERIKERLAPLRRQARQAGNEEASGLYRRIALLNDMYLDCLHTGRYLVRIGAER